MAANPPAPLRGREYLRVSKAVGGRLRSPEQQHDEMVADAAASGITLGEPYAEADAVSASRYSTKARHGFDQLMSDLASGAFDADVLILWEASRGSRRVGEWVDLLDLLEKRGVLVRVKTHGRTYDPAVPRDRRSLLDDAVSSEYEVAETSLRIRRDVAASAAAGRPHGFPNFGLRRVYDQKTGALLTWEPDTAMCGSSGWTKAEVIAELFDRLRRGHSFRGIARDFEAAGVVNGRGKPFVKEHLRTLATKAAYAGYRSHRGELTEAVWPKLVARSTWYEVQRILAGPKHQAPPRRPGRAVYAYSMIIRCDRCGGPMSVQQQRPGKYEYRCKLKGCTRIMKDPVDEALDAAIIGYLSRPDVYEDLSAAPERSEQAEILEARVAQAQRELDEAEHEEPATLAESRTLGKLIDRLTRQIDEDRRRLREMTMPPELAAFLSPSGDVAERWKDAPVEVKRRLAAILLSPAYPYLGQPRIKRSPNARRGAPLDQRLAWRRSPRPPEDPA